MRNAELRGDFDLGEIEAATPDAKVVRDDGHTSTIRKFAPYPESTFMTLEDALGTAYGHTAARFSYPR